MKKLIILSLLAIAGRCFAQNVNIKKDTSGLRNKFDFSKNNEIFPVYINATKKYQPLFYYTFEGKEHATLMTSAMFLLDQYYIKEMNVWKDELAVKKYGQVAKHGMVIITFKLGTPLINKNQLFAQYHISAADQNLPVYVDNTEVTIPDETIFIKTQIVALKIAQQKYTNLRYLSIETRDKLIRKQVK